MDSIPKTLWIYWHEGFEKAPELVKLCHRSWQRLNPDYEFQSLSDENLSDYIVPGAGLQYFDELPLQKQANIIRKQLLVAYGGVWVDATLLCTRPLEDWLPRNFPNGFLVMGNNTVDTRLSNWFIAATPGNIFVTKWLEATLSYFSRSRSKTPPVGLRFIHKQILRSTRRGGIGLKFWTHPFAKQFWPYYPHYISHYLAAEVLANLGILEDSSLGESIFESPWGPFSLRGRANSYDGDPTQELLTELYSGSIPPMLKLNHRPSSIERQIFDPVVHLVEDWLQSK